MSTRKNDHLKNGAPKKLLDMSQSTDINHSHIVAKNYTNNLACFKVLYLHREHLLKTP